jgi:hypothetical protein
VGANGIMAAHYITQDIQCIIWHKRGVYVHRNFQRCSHAISPDTISFSRLALVCMPGLVCESSPHMGVEKWNTNDLGLILLDDGTSLCQRGTTQGLNWKNIFVVTMYSWTALNNGKFNLINGGSKPQSNNSSRISLLIWSKFMPGASIFPEVMFGLMFGSP